MVRAEGRHTAARAAYSVLSVCVLGWLNCASSAEPYRELPRNAHYSSADQQGWACNNGYRQVAGFCMEIRNGGSSPSAFEVFDGKWRCRAGYHRADGYCVPATAPAHASYVGSGGRWECDWGFQRVESHCEEVKPPPHGYVDASGHDWLCYPGFERKSDQCVAGSGAPAAGAAPVGTTPGATNPARD